MDQKLDLQELEKKAYRSTFEDGLGDIEFGKIFLTVAVSLIEDFIAFSPKEIADAPQ
ncbi:MAG: hypothetical protein HWN66_07830 [Candidatus Helarchaeota archaeon]|nr:hypothetical protein [Candidatus Helarchaeota archaeon]